MVQSTSTTTSSPPTNLPIGYWLKKVDFLLTEQVDRLQAQNGISRLEWQLIHTLFEKGPLPETIIRDILVLFADAAALHNTLTQLAERGWLDILDKKADSSLYQLSPAGKQQHQLFLTVQQEIRQTAMKNITAEAYTTVVQTLQQMAANLENSPSPYNS